MIRGIVRSSMALRFLVLALAVGLIVFGVVQLRYMPVDVLPEFTPPTVEIQTEALGLAAQEVEQLITVPMEQDLLNGVPWLDTIRSESVPGMSSIVMVFKPGTDLMRARQVVAERMTQAVALPHVSKPPTMLQPRSSTGRVLMVGLSSQSLSLMQLSVLARWTIAPRLMSVPGVANVSIWGQRDRQFQVQIDPKRLQNSQASLLQVLESTANSLWVSTLSFVEASTPGTGGFIDTSNQRLGIRHLLPIASPDNLAQITIENSARRLGDVGDVVENSQPLIGDALTKDGAGLILVVEKLPNANTIGVTRGLEQALDDMRPGLSGIVADPTVFRPADFIQAALQNVALALILGLLFVALVLVALFLRWRLVLICLAAIPLSLLAGGFMLYLTGATMNAIALTGLLIALCIMIDDVIIDVENTSRRLRQYRQAGSTRSTASIILEASLEMRSPIVYATLIVVLAVAPIFLIEGAAGAFFQPLALSYMLAVLASTVVAMTVTTALSLVLLTRAPVEQSEPPLARWLQEKYARVLARVVRRPGAALVALSLLVAAGLAALLLLDQSIVPEFRQRDLVVSLRAAPGTSLPEMTRISGLIGKELRTIPGVNAVAAQVGRAVQGDQVVNASSAELWVNIAPAADYDKTVTSIQGVLKGYPGIHHSLQTYLQQQSSAVAAQPNHSIVVRVFGDTTDVLRTQAENVRQAIGGISGVSGSRIDLPVMQPAIQIEVDLAAAQRHSIKPGDVRRAAATLLSGIGVGNIFEEQKIFDVVVWSTPGTRSSLSSIRDLPINTPDGGQVRLGDVAQVRVVPAESVIRHEDVRRYLDVTVEVQDRSLGAVAADVERRLKQVQFPLEYHAEVLGGYARQQAADTRMAMVVLAAVIAGFVLLQAAFGSWRLAAVFVLILPTSLAGGLLAALLTSADMSLGTLAGLLAVFGMAVRNGMLLISHYQHLERYEGEPFGLDLILRGARERMTPILTSALATGLALAPALLLGNLPGLEIMGRMAVVVLGGLLTSTVLNLLILPTLYLRGAISAEEDPELALIGGAAQEAAAGGM